MRTNTPTEKATRLLFEIFETDNPLDTILQMRDIDQWEVFQLLDTARMLNERLRTKERYIITFYEVPDEDKTFIKLETKRRNYTNYEESETDDLWMNQTLRGEASATEINLLIKTLQLTWES